MEGLQKSQIKNASKQGKSILKIFGFKKNNSSECGDGLESLNSNKKMSRVQFCVPYNKRMASN